MKAKVTFDQKRKAVFEYYKNKDKAELASLIIALMYNKDIIQEYRELPADFKRRVNSL